MHRRAKMRFESWAPWGETMTSIEWIHEACSRGSRSSKYASSATTAPNARVAYGRGRDARLGRRATDSRAAGRRGTRVEKDAFGVPFPVRLSIEDADARAAVGRVRDLGSTRVRNAQLSRLHIFGLRFHSFQLMVGRVSISH